MRKYVIMGVQGSGKGTQSALLAEDLDLVQISVGDIFRWHIQQHTKLGAQIRRTIDAGHLVPDDVVESVVRQRLEQHDWNYGFIIDGFPRSRSQAEFFLESYDIDGVVHLHLPDEEVRRRVLARRLCSRCGLDYNLIFHRPAVEDRCDVCGGELVRRPTTPRKPWPTGCATITGRPTRCSTCSGVRSTSSPWTPARIGSPSSRRSAAA